MIGDIAYFGGIGVWLLSFIKWQALLDSCMMRYVTFRYLAILIGANCIF